MKPGMLLRFAIGDQGLSLVEGKPVVADIHFQGVANKNRARRADTCTKVHFQQFQFGQNSRLNETLSLCVTSFYF